MSRKKVQHIVLEGIKSQSNTKKTFDTAETIAVQSKYSEKDKDVVSGDLFISMLAFFPCL
mgnify:CR=1 FL=1